LLDKAAEKPPPPLFLLQGDRVLAEPAAMRLAETLAAQAGCEVEVHRRPAELGRLLADLRTYSLFATAKVVVAIDSAVLADRGAAADLIDEAAEVLPITAPAEEPTSRERRAARRLLRALQLFQIDPYRSAAGEVLAELPSWALKGGTRSRRGGGRGRSAKKAEQLRSGLVDLLELARGTEVEGWAESELADLGGLIDSGLPEGHTLVLAESMVAKGHPLAVALAERGCAIRVGEVESQRGGRWQGLDLFAAELERETGVAIDTGALDELAKRTLRQRRGRGAGQTATDSDSTARFAAEYRKLAGLTEGGAIDRKLVLSAVEDRGEEDVWQILDAIGAGRGGEALQRLDRLLASADDRVATRLSVFALLAEFCRHLTVVSGLASILGVSLGQKNYARFKSQTAPKLQAEVVGGVANPIHKLHPFRLHKACLAASRMPPELLSRLPARVLETELRLKGDSRAAEAALAEFVGQLTATTRG
jgi:hypothetical protein